MEKQLREALSGYDIDKSFEETMRRKWLKTKEARYFLPHGEYAYKGPFSDSLYPDKQFSFVAYAPCRCPASLIDLKTKEVFFLFAHDRVTTLVWDNSGKAIAYAADKFYSYDNYAFVILNAVEGRTILRKELVEADGIADVAFSPDAKHVAVISYTKRPGFWPHEILLQSSGHGIFYHTYYLEVYDMSGKVFFKKILNGSYKNSAAHIVWID